MHLHVISGDLCSPTLKHKKHYNSFHPKLGFFMHLDDVVEWFDAEPEVFKTVRACVNTSLLLAKPKMGFRHSCLQLTSRNTKRS